MAPSVVEAMKIADEWRPTIALVDWRLADGLADKLVGRLLLDGAGVVVVSGSGRAEIGLREAAALAFVEKPVSDSELAAAVERILRRA